MSRLFEKVSKGLECCISLNGGPMDHDCKECPYNVGDKNDTCISIIPMLEDALKELKEYDSGMQTLGEMNDAQSEKIAIKQVALKRIADIAYDYDGYDSVEGLKSLIDEIREIAIKGVQNE